MYIEKVLDLRVQLIKNGGKYKSVAFVILFSIYIYIYTHTRLIMINSIQNKSCLHNMRVYLLCIYI